MSTFASCGSSGNSAISFPTMLWIPRYSESPCSETGPASRSDSLCGRQDFCDCMQVARNTIVMHFVRFRKKRELYWLLLREERFWTLSIIFRSQSSLLRHPRHRDAAFWNFIFLNISEETRCLKHFFWARQGSRLARIRFGRVAWPFWTDSRRSWAVPGLAWEFRGQEGPWGRNAPNHRSHFCFVTQFVKKCFVSQNRKQSAPTLSEMSRWKV